MSELGTRLKEARTAKGYSLEDLQEMTKIQKRYLAGIEEGNYSMMPGPFYVRAFIKQYADAVGLNSDELLESYKQEVPTSSKEEVYQTMNTAPSRRRPISRSSSRVSEVFPMILVALFIIGALVIFWFLYQNMAQKDEPTEEEVGENTVIIDKKEEPETPVEEEPEEEEPVEEEPVEEPEPTQTIEVGAVEGETTNYTLSGTDTFALKIVARGNSWVEVRDQAGVKPLSRNVAAGETVNLDLSDVETARIRIGASPQVDVFINDEKVEYGTPTSDRVTQNMMIQFSKQ
ncbi:helix-turn-helix domain-containing protein [Paenisporosarcina quisquiliarum]|uniref:helix-turn-helix domain-containing protein n=1 Tax=Paenisporosarcina quisquiliarum TaxID=365346 RepID=UPI003735BC3A